MDFKTLQHIFLNIQKNTEIFTIKFDNWSLWDISKNYLFFQILFRYIKGERETLTNKINKRKNEIINRSINYFIAQFEWRIVRNKYVNKEREVILLFVSSAHRYANKNKKFISPFGEEINLMNNRKFDLFIIENNKKSKRNNNVLCKPDLRENIIEFPNIIDKILPIKKNKNLEQAIFKLAETIKIELKDSPEMQSIFFEELFSKEFRRKTMSFPKEKRRAITFLRQLHPSALLFSSIQNYYPTIAAAKEMKIPVIEIQHGVMDRDHIEHQWPAYMKNKKRELLSPDKIFMWGRYWVEQKLKTGFWSPEELFAYGHSRMDYIKSQIRIHHEDNTRELACKEIYFLYTSQFPYRKSAINFLEDFLKNIPKELNIKLIIKLHPLEDSEYIHYKILQDSFPKHCIVHYHKEKSLYDLFFKVHVHLSVNSASIFESIELGTPTAILNIPGKDYFKNLIENKLLKLIETPSDLIKLSKQIIENTSDWKKWLEITRKSKNYFFSYNTNQNYLKHLNIMIEKESLRMYNKKMN